MGSALGKACPQLLRLLQLSLSLSLSLLSLLFSMICITVQSMKLDCNLLRSVGEVNLKLY